MAIPPTLETLRGDLPPARANARTVAALTGNPGCTRRRVLDGARVRSHELADRLGFPAERGQSPFAIATGNRFEFRLKKGSDYKLLIEALAPLVKLPSPPRVLDLSGGRPARQWDRWLRKRAEQTRQALAAIARGDATAPHLVDHPVVELDLGGTTVFLEPDGLAFRVGSQLELVEIKSYAVIDGQADGSKLSSTASQAAVYVIALRAELERLGFDPELLQPSVILVAPRNFGRTATAHRVPLGKKVAALQRVLRHLPKTKTLLERSMLPKGATFDVDPKANAAARKQLDSLVRALPMLYRPECLASCDMAKYCRNQAQCAGDPAVLGRAARDALAGVPTLADALRLAKHGPKHGEEALADVAEMLSHANQALERARATLTPGGRP